MPRRSRRGYYLDRWIDESRLTKGELILFVAEVKDKTKPTIKKLRELGYKEEALQIERVVKQVAKEEITELNRAAIVAARQNVPIDSHDLQKRFIDSKIEEDKDGLPVGTVYVRKGDHYGSRRRKPEKAPALAAYLDRPDRPLSRTKTNTKQTKGTPTDDWIQDAHQDFRRLKNAIIRREI